jgi:hypothetical protein
MDDLEKLINDEQPKEPLKEAPKEEPKEPSQEDLVAQEALKKQKELENLNKAIDFAKESLRATRQEISYCCACSQNRRRSRGNVKASG